MISWTISRMITSEVTWWPLAPLEDHHRGKWMPGRWMHAHVHWVIIWPHGWGISHVVHPGVVMPPSPSPMIALLLVMMMVVVLMILRGWRIWIWPWPLTFIALLMSTLIMSRISTSAVWVSITVLVFCSLLVWEQGVLVLLWVWGLGGFITGEPSLLLILLFILLQLIRWGLIQPGFKGLHHLKEPFSTRRLQLLQRNTKQWASYKTVGVIQDSGRNTRQWA